MLLPRSTAHSRAGPASSRRDETRLERQLCFVPTRRAAAAACQIQEGTGREGVVAPSAATHAMRTATGYYTPRPMASWHLPTAARRIYLPFTTCVLHGLGLVFGRAAPHGRITKLLEGTEPRHTRPSAACVAPQVTETRQDRTARSARVASRSQLSEHHGGWARGHGATGWSGAGRTGAGRGRAGCGQSVSREPRDATGQDPPFWSIIPVVAPPAWLLSARLRSQLARSASWHNSAHAPRAPSTASLV